MTFPGEKVQVLICSANLGNACPDETSFNAWIPEDGRCEEVLVDEPRYPLSFQGEKNPHHPGACSEDEKFALVVFGLQESTFEVDAPPSATLTPELSECQSEGSEQQRTASKTARKMKEMKTLTKQKIESLTASRDHTTAKSGSGSRVLHALMENRLPSYDRIVSFQRGEMRLEIFANPSKLQVEVLHVAAQNTGRHGLANKGGITAELMVNETTRLSFVTTHLEAHEGRYATRVSTMNEIFAGTKEKHHDCSLSAHHSFVMGDLNFRSEHVDREEMGEEKHKELVWDIVERKDWQALYEIDELSRALQSKHCLTGYRTPDCLFPPTFKVERSAGHSYVEQRLPSYTDRVLWKSNHRLETKVQPLVYEPIDYFSSSDHKPIRAAFEIELNASFQLSAKGPRTASFLNLMSEDFGSHMNLQCHLFVNEIEFKINHRDDKNNWVPNPYLCLISDPPECLQVASESHVKVFMSQVAKALSLKSSKSARSRRLGFPGSSIQHQQFESNLAREEVCAELATHQSDGSSIELAGTMLFLTLMDYKPSLPDDNVVGTVTVNLADLMRQCRRTPQEDPSAKVEETSPHGLRRLFGRLRQQSVAIFRNGQLDCDPSDSDFVPIESVDIDQPLLKNGVEKGTLKCKVEVWWMDSSLNSSSFLLTPTRR